MDLQVSVPVAVGLSSQCSRELVEFYENGNSEYFYPLIKAGEAFASGRSSFECRGRLKRLSYDTVQRLHDTIVDKAWKRLEQNIRSSTDIRTIVSFNQGLLLSLRYLARAILGALRDANVDAIRSCQLSVEAAFRSMSLKFNSHSTTFDDELFKQLCDEYSQGVDHILSEKVGGVERQRARYKAETLRKEIASTRQTLQTTLSLMKELDLPAIAERTSRSLRLSRQIRRRDLVRSAMNATFRNGIGSIWQRPHLDISWSTNAYQSLSREKKFSEIVAIAEVAGQTVHDLQGRLTDAESELLQLRQEYGLS